MSRLPDFVIVGAGRSGSTALYRYLGEHPAVFMATPKEVRYFNKHFDNGLDWYSAHFAAAGEDQVAGEATPSYLGNAEAVDRMAATIPKARLIALLRDPVDRLYSHYWMDRNRDATDETFEAWLQSSVQVERSRYVASLRYLTRFYPRDRLLVLFHDDLERRPQALYQNACRFIDVDDTVVPQSLGRTINPYVEFRSLRARTWSKRLPRSLAPVKKVVGRLNTRTKTSYPPMKPATRRRLAEYYVEPNADLAVWLGRDIPAWTTPTDP
jgi:hypothetical protein